VEELVALAAPYGALVVYDLGSGQLTGDPTLGNDSVRRSLDAGIDLVLFSGDKLLGGPQCGIGAGRQEVIERLRTHPVMRMVRPGKLTLLALEATLRAWERDPAGSEIPSSVMLERSEAELQTAAEALARAIAEAHGARYSAEVTSVSSTTGGGTGPLVRLPSFAVALRAADEGAAALAARLRRGEPAIVSRVDDDRVLLDLRTLLDGEASQIVAALGGG
jgi:L-seryl-tRNA(Ser) seleniumtransferase